MIPSAAELHYFIEVATTLNISRAAERLGISQPSLSLAIKRLEDNVGVPLLIRSKSGVALTRTGQKFSVQARELLERWDQVKSSAQKEHSDVSGRYTLGCHESVALYSLPLFLPQLLQEHAELEFKVEHGLSRQITDDVIGFKIDFAIVVNPVAHPDLVIKLIAKDEVQLYRGEGNHPCQSPISGEGILISHPDLIQSQTLYKQIKKRNYNFIRTVTSTNLEVITALTSAGAGVGILPGRVATKTPAQKLSPIGNSPKYQDRICLVYRADAQKSPASRKISEFILSQLKKSL